MTWKKHLILCPCSPPAKHILIHFTITWQGLIHLCFQIYTRYLGVSHSMRIINIPPPQKKGIYNDMSNFQWTLQVLTTAKNPSIILYLLHHFVSSRQVMKGFPPQVSSRSQMRIMVQICRVDPQKLFGRACYYHHHAFFSRHHRHGHHQHHLTRKPLLDVMSTDWESKWVEPWAEEKVLERLWAGAQTEPWLAKWPIWKTAPPCWTSTKCPCTSPAVTTQKITSHFQTGDQ